jgi:hypothetical protein
MTEEQADKQFRKAWFQAFGADGRDTPRDEDTVLVTAVFRSDGRKVSVATTEDGLGSVGHDLRQEVKTGAS